MSDIKQQILDELEGRMSDKESASYIAGLMSGYAIIEKHLEGMVIVPSEPTSIMLGIGEFLDDDNETVYKEMIAAFKESGQ